MGVNCTFYAVGPEVAKTTLDRIVWRACSDHHNKMALRLRDDGYANGRYEFCSIFRCYGRDYARGHWPDIYAIIRLLRHELPEHEIRYGGDCGDDGDVCTDAFLDGMWQFWLIESRARYLDYFDAGRPTCCGGAMRAGRMSLAWRQYECCVCDRKIQIGADGAEQPFDDRNEARGKARRLS